MAFDPTAFTQELIKDAQLDQATTAALQAAFTNPQVAKRLEESTLRQGEFSKKMDEYKVMVKKAQDYWDGLNLWNNDNRVKLEQEVATLKQKLAGADPSLDDLDGKNKTDFIGKDELKKLAQESLSYMNAVTKLGMQHLKEFGEVLDVDKLVEQATRDGVNINIAYSQLIQPKRDEIQRADFEKQLARAREEGKQEALKNVAIPSSEQPFSNSIPHSVETLSKKPEDRASEFGSMAAVKAWKENRTKINPLPF